MGAAFVSGAALEHLAYVVPRAVALPFHAALWSGNEFFAAIAFFALWHYGFWQPTLGLDWTNTDAATNPFASLTDESGEYVGYLGILGGLALAAALAAVLAARLLDVPRNLVPLRRLVALPRRPPALAVPALGYAWTALALGVVVAVASFLPYELTARYLGARSLAALCVGTLVPATATLLACAILFAAAPPNFLYATHVPGRAAATAVRLAFATVAVTVPVPIAVYVVGTFDVAWIVGGASLLVTLLGAAFYGGVHGGDAALARLFPSTTKKKLQHIQLDIEEDMPDS